MAIARGLAERLGVTVELVGLPTPPRAVECVKTGACDVVIAGIEPSRAAQVDFSPPVIQFDYTYLVPAGSSLHSVAEVDRPGMRIAVVRNHASTFALRRIVRHAELVDAEMPDPAFELLRAGTAHAYAAPREALIDYSARLPGSRVLADAYGANLVGLAVQRAVAAARLCHRVHRGGQGLGPDPARDRRRRPARRARGGAAEAGMNRAARCPRPGCVKPTAAPRCQPAGKWY